MIRIASDVLDAGRRGRIELPSYLQEEATMTSEVLHDLRRDMMRINRAIRNELPRARPDLLKVIDPRRLESGCTDRLARATAALRAAKRRRIGSTSPVALQGARQ